MSTIGTTLWEPARIMREAAQRMSAEQKLAVAHALGRRRRWIRGGNVTREPTADLPHRSPGTDAAMERLGIAE